MNSLLDADNGPQLAAKPDGAADNSAISSKAPLPKRVAEHNSVGSARAIFVLRKAAAEHGLYPQSAEKVRTDTEGMKVLRLSRAREIDAHHDSPLLARMSPGPERTGPGGNRVC